MCESCSAVCVPKATDFEFLPKCHVPLCALHGTCLVKPVCVDLLVIEFLSVCVISMAAQ